jgi:hypothetical protein
MKTYSQGPHFCRKFETFYPVKYNFAKQINVAFSSMPSLHYNSKQEIKVQSTSESQTVRLSNGHLSDTFCVRLSNGWIGPFIYIQWGSESGRIRFSDSRFSLGPGILKPNHSNTGHICPDFEC